MDTFVRIINIQENALEFVVEFFQVLLRISQLLFKVPNFFLHLWNLCHWRCLPVLHRCHLCHPIRCSVGWQCSRCWCKWRDLSRIYAILFLGSSSAINHHTFNFLTGRRVTFQIVVCFSPLFLLSSSSSPKYSSSSEEDQLPLSEFWFLYLYGS